MSGSTDGLSFASKHETQLTLPWTSGESHLCTQGNRTAVTHQGRHATSWDFWMWPGTVVRAARAGEVVEVRSGGSDWPGLHPGNRVIVRHDDGTPAIDAHLQGSGMRVTEGDRVARGEPLGEAGLSGFTLYPHLHFQVRGPDGRPVPSSFRDVREVDGVPRVFGVYTADASD
jgi:murein DD-endopeptidase MepM/ murein hydrolase activator NlpD